MMPFSLKKPRGITEEREGYHRLMPPPQGNRKIASIFNHVSSMDENSLSGEWWNYDGWCGTKSKHITFKISPLATDKRSIEYQVGGWTHFKKSFGGAIFQYFSFFWGGGMRGWFWYPSLFLSTSLSSSIVWFGLDCHIRWYNSRVWLSLLCPLHWVQALNIGTNFFFFFQYYPIKYTVVYLAETKHYKLHLIEVTHKSHKSNNSHCTHPITKKKKNIYRRKK